VTEIESRTHRPVSQSSSELRDGLPSSSKQKRISSVIAALRADLD